MLLLLLLLLSIDQESINSFLAHFAGTTCTEGSCCWLLDIDCLQLERFPLYLHQELQYLCCVLQFYLSINECSIIEPNAAASITETTHTIESLVCLPLIFEGLCNDKGGLNLAGSVIDPSHTEGILGHNYSEKVLL